MKMLFKQRFFSWLDSYDIYGEDGQTLFTVEGKLSWGHKLEIYNSAREYMGRIQEEVFTFLPRFRMYVGEDYIGDICKEFTFFRPSFTLECNGWQIQGDFLEWDYSITDGQGNDVAKVSKQIWNWTDTYTIEVYDPVNALFSLMIVLAIDAAKCSDGK